ncbi:MAG: pantetheine-phosphate adenylyltransferase [Nitrospirae bacterium]|nr:pantetheine-phosphate adenylyltransferase [Nitrospirota bacterium]
MRRIGVYPGTFDPFTNGHLDLVVRSRSLFDHVIIAIAPNLDKAPLFSPKERLEMVQEALQTTTEVTVELFDGLLVDFVRARRAQAIIRGLRAVSDFEYELQIALMNRKLADRIETIFLMPSEEYTYLSSTIIKTVASYHGAIDAFVPPGVARRLKERFGAAR